jgi:two-component system response regulator
MGVALTSPRVKIILLVEDDPDHEALTVRALRRNRFVSEIVVARDGAEALEYLIGPSSQDPPAPRRLPAFVLLDLKLPRVDGLEVLRQVRDNDRTRLVPIVILTSSDEEKDMIEGYSLGANSFVRKPVDFTEFTEAARQLSQYWLVLNQTAHSIG